MSRHARHVPVLLAALVTTTALLASPVLASPEAGSTPPLLAPLSDGSHYEPPIPELDPEVPSPVTISGEPLGSRFHHWSSMLDYLEALDTASDRVTAWRYGESYEGRPLMLVAVSSAENIARLEAIRRANLELTGTLPEEERRERAAEAPVIVWLGYGVHGNESSSSEAALATLYLLAAARGEAAEILDRVVILVDPLSNPDGRERYVTAHEQRRGHRADPDPAAAEHFEPWPGGRQNHYLIDLNRDWAWASQVETRQRLEAYRAWEPHVHVDLHEMSSRSTYFFPPSAEPIHPRIPPQLIDWLEVFGRGNARAFDERGWLYYKEENFDLFYPGYGDSYPALRGAVGMTYEMAGGGRAGTIIRHRDGRTLTLSDRIARHLTASLATVRTAAENRRELLVDFVAFRRPPDAEEAVTYLWEAGQGEAMALAELLAVHGIRVERLERPLDLTVRSVSGPGDPAAMSRRSFPAGTFAVTTAQPLSRLVATLLERSSSMPEGFLARQRERLEDGLRAEFYDITGWSLALAFNLDVHQTRGVPAGLTPAALPRGGGTVQGEGTLGYLVAPAGLAGFRAAAGLQAADVLYRQALEPFEVAGRSFPAGTLFVPATGNPDDLEARMVEIAGQSGVDVRRVDSSYSSAGISLGSERMIPVLAPRVGLLGGDGVSQTSFGALWHLLDREVPLPGLSRLTLERFASIDLADLDVLVLPDGSYGKHLGEAEAGRIRRWLQAGGTLVAIGEAVDWLGEHELTEITTGRQGSGSEDGGRGPDETPQQTIYTPGAVVATELSTHHPLAAGLSSAPPALVRGSRVLERPAGGDGSLLRIATGSPVLGGFAWPEAEEQLAGSLLVTTEEIGAGRLVVFAQDPVFRLFWRGTMPLLLNAVMHAPSLGPAGRY